MVNIAQIVTEKLLKATPALRKNQIIFAYLFGSAAEGRLSPLSDIDIALFLNPNLNQRQRFYRRLECMTLLERILERDDIDVIILNDSEADIIDEVLRYGKLLFCFDDNSLYEFRHHFTMMYLDFSYYRDRHLNYVINRLKNREEPNGRRKKYQNSIREIRRRFGTIEAD